MIWVGIDCGVHTGYAVWDSDLRAFVEVRTVAMHTALFAVRELIMHDDVSVVVEDARQRRWIPDTHDIRREMGRRQGAGSVKRDAKIWEDFLSEAKVPFQMVAPAKGATKWTADAFRNLTGWDGSTTEHSRDAAMLVFGR